MNLNLVRLSLAFSFILSRGGNLIQYNLDPVVTSKCVFFFFLCQKEGFFIFFYRQIFIFNYLFIYLFIFGCVGSSFLRKKAS